MKLFPAQISALHTTVQYSPVELPVVLPVLLLSRSNASVRAEHSQLWRSDSQSISKHGAGQGPGGPSHRHYERQRGQDHGEGGQAPGPGEQGRTVAGRLPAVSGVKVVVTVHLLTEFITFIENSHQSQEKSLVGKYENEARNNRRRVLLISIISPDNSLQSERIEERGERREYPRHSKCQLDTMFSM